MIGTDLNLTLPDAGQTIATNTARTATALAAIEAAIADKATPAAIDVNAPLVMNGNSVTEVGSVVFADGNSSASAGSIYYRTGDWYVVDAVGTIQLTDNGAINASGIGGIVGDYGGVNPARVSYDDATGQFRFTEDTGVYADLVADDLVLNGSAGSVRFSVDAAITSALTFNVKSLPATGSSLLIYDASDSSLKDGNATAPTNSLKGPVTVNGTLTASNFDAGAGKYKYTSASRSVPAIAALANITAGSVTTTVGTPGANLAINTSAYFPILVDTDEKTQITGVVLLFTAAVGAGVTAALYRGGSTFIAVAGATGAGTGLTTITLTPTTPFVIGGSDPLWVLIVTNASSTPKVAWFNVLDRVI